MEKRNKRAKDKEGKKKESISDFLLPHNPLIVSMDLNNASTTNTQLHQGCKYVEEEAKRVLMFVLLTRIDSSSSMHMMYN